MLIGSLDASLLGNILTGRGINKKGKGINIAGEGIVRAGYGNKIGRKATTKCNKKQNGFLMLPHSLTNFEI